LLVLQICEEKSETFITLLQYPKFPSHQKCSVR